MPDLQMNIKEIADITYIRFAGRLTENNDLPMLMKYKPTVVINTRELRQVNSCGLRDWEDWLGQIKSDIYLIELSPCMIEQANISQRVLGDATVISLFVPLFCPECDYDEDELIDASQVSTELTLHHLCPKCGQEMDFSEPLALYFSFSTRSKLGTDNAKLLSIIQANFS